MRISTYDKFIKENIAPYEAKRIGIYNARGRRVGGFGLQSLTATDMGEKLYSFGALADVHIPYNTAEADFRKALDYFANTEKVAFVCVAGDLTSGGSDYQFKLYQQIVNSYYPNGIESILGNHDNYSTAISNTAAKAYTQRELYYSFEHEGDVFIMISISGYQNGSLFTSGQLDWLQTTLEKNQDKRCFLFHHVRPQDGCGDAFDIYDTPDNDIWGGDEAALFESLMTRYKNVHQFHGHSHLKLNLQTKDNLANIDRIFGGWSIHIPSLSVPRSGDESGSSSRVEIYAESEGYVVDVYENGIVLRGIDFVNDKPIPLAQYYLDTTVPKS